MAYLTTAGKIHILWVSSLYFTLVKEVETYGAPSFVSTWVPMKSQSNSQSEIHITHPLGDYPAKIDVQVLVTDSGEDYIFPGEGTAFRDDDIYTKYGGVVFIYNTQEVTIFVPNAGNDYTGGVCIYTGGDRMLGSKSISGSYTEVQVRVRAWTLDDMGEASFVKRGIEIDDDTKTYVSVGHMQNAYPDHVVVQVEYNDGWMSNAQGSTQASKKYDIYCATGGVLFAYDDKDIRIWTMHTGELFTCDDGWGNERYIVWKEGNASIYVYKFTAEIKVFNTTLRMGVDNNVSSTEVEFPQTYEYNPTDILQVEVEAIDGLNQGFRFYGTGSYNRNPYNGPFGGVIFGYSSTKVLLWRPNGETYEDCYMIFVGNMLGEGEESQESKTADVHIRVFSAPKLYTHSTFEQVHTDITGLAVLKLTDEKSTIACVTHCTEIQDCEYVGFDEVSYTCHLYKTGGNSRCNIMTEYCLQKL